MKEYTDEHLIEVIRICHKQYKLRIRYNSKTVTLTVRN